MNKIDDFLLVFMKYTDNQVPHGLLSDIARLLGKSRERVRQRAEFLKLTSHRTVVGIRLCEVDQVPLGPNKHKYCSTRCARAARVARLPKMNCLQCGKEFAYLNSQDNNLLPRKFCSNPCYSEYRILESIKNRDVNKIIKVCIGCGMSFNVKPSRYDQKYHSHHCYAQNQTK